MMSYYSERNGLRTPIKTTYEITAEMYSLLFDCCEKYYENIAWKYPDECPDNRGYIGLNIQKLNLDLKYEIPNLYRDNFDMIAKPKTQYSFEYDEISKANQYALLDLIEFFAKNVRDVVKYGKDYHAFFQHYHLTFLNTNEKIKVFKKDINDIFRKTGLLYFLNDNYQVERIVENSPLTSELVEQITSINEDETRKLLQEAIDIHRSHSTTASRDACEKLWDAFERMKTYYIDLDKKNSGDKVISNIAKDNQKFTDLFKDEFKKITDIGNNYRIRHHETSQTDIHDSRYYDYFFNRCISLMALAIQYLE